MEGQILSTLFSTREEIELFAMQTYQINVQPPTLQIL